MSSDVIVVSGMRFPATAGTPTTVPGVHSGKPLAVIEIRVSTGGTDDRSLVEGLFTQGSVEVVDPFARRSYTAKVRQKQSSYTEGRPERRYVFEVREEDTIPEVTSLDIDGHAFDVMQYHEQVLQDGVLIRSALLRLTEAQLTELRDLVKPGTFAFKRVGIDAEPLVARFGGAMYWSRHSDEGDIYYKHIVRFLSPEKDDDNKKLARLASGTEIESLTLMVQALQARFLALVDELAASNVISEERRTLLLRPDWATLLDEGRIAEIGWQTHQVSDAEDELA